MDGNHDRDGQLLEAVKHIQRRHARTPFVGDALVPQADIGAGAEVTQTTLQQNGTTTVRYGFLKRLQQGDVQSGTGEIVRPIDHTENGDGAIDDSL